MEGGMMLGRISVEEFNRLNAEGAAMVAAITPTSTALSRGDQKLMMEVAMGGMMQLEVSRAALARVTSPQARLLAQSEVEEQTA
jgi:putative membrane protein